MVNRDRARSRSRHDSSDTITLPLGEEVMSLTKYGFPRRRTLPAARFRQWHFNRTPKSSKLSCLHLHRVFSSPLPFPSPAHGFALREFTCRAATQSAANAHRMPRGVADARGITLASNRRHSHLVLYAY